MLKRTFIVLALIFVVVWIGAGVRVAFLETNPLTKTAERKDPVPLDRMLAQDLHVTFSDYKGLDMLSVGNARTEKRRRGVLAFGALNVLVLDDLKILIPNEALATEEQNGAMDVELRRHDGRTVLKRLGLKDDFLKSNGVGVRFSGLQINRMSVSVVLDRTNVVPRFVAQSAEAKRDGLHLKGCCLLAGGVSNHVGKALLKVKPSLHLEWKKGHEELAIVSSSRK